MWYRHVADFILSHHVDETGHLSYRTGFASFQSDPDSGMKWKGGYAREKMFQLRGVLSVPSLDT